MKLSRLQSWDIGNSTFNIMSWEEHEGLSHGYIKNDFDVDKWAAPEFLEQAATEVFKEKWEKKSWSKLPQGGGLEVDGIRLG